MSPREPDFSHLPGLIELATTDYPESVRDLAAIGTHGLAVVAAGAGDVARDDLPARSYLEFEYQVKPPRWSGWTNGGVWREARPKVGDVLLSLPGVRGRTHRHGPHEIFEIGVPLTFFRERRAEIGAGGSLDLARFERPYLRDPLLSAVIAEIARVALDRRMPTADAYADHLAEVLIRRVLILLEPEPRPSRGARPLTWSEVRRIESFARAHLEESVTVARLGAELGLTEFHFNRAFRAAVGEPPYRWLLGLRVEEAVARLRREGADAAERIARDCGFGERRHLARTLRSRFGASIRELLEQEFPPSADE